MNKLIIVLLIVVTAMTVGTLLYAHSVESEADKLLAQTEYLMDK